MCHTSEFGITIYDVLTLGGAQQVGTPSRKGEIKVLCPHGVKTSRGKTATFDVNLAKSNFKCYRECTDCIGHGGMLDLYNLLCGSGADRKTAYAEIVSKLKYGDLPKSERLAEPAFVPQKMQGNAADAPVLDKAYRAFLATLTLSERHRANLLSRGLTERAIQQGLYKSVPQGQARRLESRCSKRAGRKAPSDHCHRRRELLRAVGRNVPVSAKQEYPICRGRVRFRPGNECQRTKIARKVIQHRGTIRDSDAALRLGNGAKRRR